LATRLKDGLAGLGHVTLATPRSPVLSAGIVCFSVRGLAPDTVVERLRSSHWVVATVTPYATQLVRLGPSIATDEADVDRAIAALRTMG
jgi:selenocysteine lyase/cysteine desulfurase